MYYTVLSPYTVVYENQALEALLFESLEPDDEIMLLYVNAASVLAGRHQDPELEYDLKLLPKANILPARRISGGGTVYHDLGNLNTAFLSRKGRVSREYSLHRFREMCEKVTGLEFRVRDGLDLLLEDKKVSGSAYLIRGDRFLHHATLLVSSDLTGLRLVLTPDRAHHKAAGTYIASRPSEVTSLETVVPGVDTASVIDRFISEFSSEIVRDPFGLPGITEAQIRERAEEFGSVEWIFRRQ